MTEQVGTKDMRSFTEILCKTLENFEWRIHSERERCVNLLSRAGRETYCFEIVNYSYCGVLF